MSNRLTVTGAARLAGVIGWPVSHSRSPALQNFWLARYRVDGVYVPLPVRPGEFETVVRGLVAAGFRGVNVTIPHKEAAFAISDTIDPMARSSGSVNTLVFRADGRIEGYSTDGPGYIASLVAEGIDPLAGRVLLLGAGGAARSIAAGMLAQGVEVWVTNRTEARAQELARFIPGLKIIPWSQWEARLGEFALLVNTTSLGMDKGPDEAYLPDLSMAKPSLAVSDIVYVPRVTPLLREARRLGLVTVGGIGMLLHQAKLGFRAWYGIEPEVDAATLAHVMPDSDD